MRSLFDAAAAAAGCSCVFGAPNKNATSTAQRVDYFAASVFLFSSCSFPTTHTHTETLSHTLPVTDAVTNAVIKCAAISLAPADCDAG